ncbi:MAG: holo-ACP synthase [Treponema sp.]|nr:holo-ACP synthase [Treponema sp.]
MILGIGTDIASVSRFEKWVKDSKMTERFFHECEIIPWEEDSCKKMSFFCQHYAARFAAKEAFSKALGTGFVGLELSDFGIKNDENGRPYFHFGEKTRNQIEKIMGKGAKVFVSISHEKEYAVSFVVIEK